MHRRTIVVPFCVICIAASMAWAQNQTPHEAPPATWTDPSTGLMWAKQDNGAKVNWNGAVDYCQNLNLAGYRDWKLPEIGKLSGLYDPSVSRSLSVDEDQVQYHIKGGIELTAWWHWSATKKGSGEAWGFHFSNGGRYSVRLDNVSLRALCMRRSGK